MKPFVIDLDPDPNQRMECTCGWRGARCELTLHPRQGFGVCPRCWRAGYERMPSGAREYQTTRESDMAEQNEQSDPNTFVIREATGATKDTCTHVRGFYGDSGANEGVLSVHAVVQESAMYPETARIIVGTPVASPLMEGYHPDLGGFSCSVEAMRRFIKVASRACDDAEAAMKAGR